MRRKRKDIRGRVDIDAFINLKTTNNMNIKQEHREMLGKFVATKGYEIMKGQKHITFNEVFDILKETIIQTKRLRDIYDDNK